MASQPASVPAGSRPDGRSRPAELLAGVRDGNARALQALVDLYWTPLVGFASGILRCEDAAEDVVQRAFIRFWERRDAWQPGSDPKLILYTVARNLALNQLESDRARVRRRSAPLVPRPSISTPAQLLEEAEMVRALESAIELLSPRRREALVLARFHNLSHAEIAEVMGLAQRTVANHITTALAELETALSRYLAED